MCKQQEYKRIHLRAGVLVEVGKWTAIFAIYSCQLINGVFQIHGVLCLQLISHPCIIRAVQSSTDAQAAFWALLILCFWLSVLNRPALAE